METLTSNFGFFTENTPNNQDTMYDTKSSVRDRVFGV